MRESFIGYFEPTSEIINQRWKSALIVLDTNVLLGLYRMPSEARRKIQDLLHKFKDRLWIPYHVLVEYHANRLDVLKREYEAVLKMDRDIQTAFEAFRASIATEGNKSRHCWEDVNNQLNEIATKITAIRSTVKAESANYVSPSDSDSVRDFVEELFTGRVGPRPADQDAVDAAQAYAQKRFGFGIGPGFKDDAKAGRLRVMDGLVYDRQYGDFMIWSQLLDHCKESGKEEGLESVLFVTSDVKEDWWLDTKTNAGKRVQPELVMEMRRVAKVHDFDMYTLTQFYREGSKYLKVDVEQSTIDEVARAEDPQAGEFRKLADFVLSVIDHRRLSRDAGRKYLHADSEDFPQIIKEVSGVVLSVGGAGGVGVSFDDEGLPVGKLVMPLGAIIEEDQTTLRALLQNLINFGPVPEVEVYLVSKGATSSAPATQAFRSYIRNHVQAIRPEVGAVRVWIGGPADGPESGTIFNLL